MYVNASFQLQVPSRCLYQESPKPKSNSLTPSFHNSSIVFIVTNVPGEYLR